MNNGTEVGKLYYDLDIDDRKLKSGLQKSGGHLNSFGSKLTALGKKMAVTFAAAGAAATAFGISSVKAFTESEDAIAQTNAVLKSTKGVAGVTAKQVDKLAVSLQKVTKFSDEEVRSAENMLLTFTNISEDIFPQTTKTVLDMSQALGQDLKSSSIQLGKALNDPILGLTALGRVGVKFTADQKKTITSLVESGKTMQAQKLILKELQTEFGGSAEAAGKTFSGQLTILKNSLNDVQETIGRVIVSGLTPFAQKAAAFVNHIDWTEVIDRASRSLDDLWKNHLLPLGRAIRDVGMRVANYLRPKLEALINTLQEVVPAVINLLNRAIRPLASVVGQVFVGAIGLAIDTINALLRLSNPIINWMSRNSAAVLGLAAAFGTLAVSIKIWDLIDHLRIAFEILRLQTIPNLIATFRTLSAFMLGPMGLAIAGLSFAIGLIVAGFVSARNDADRLRNAQDALKRSTDELRNSQRELKRAQLDQEAASLSVERAQRTYNEAVRQFGSKSLEARQALNDLRQAQLRVKDAQDRTKQSLIDLQVKQKAVTDNKANITRLNNEAKAYAGLRGEINKTTEARQKELNQGLGFKGKSAEGIHEFRPPGRAEGGPVGAFKPYMVGERGKELFIPNQNGFVLPNRLTEALMDGRKQEVHQTTFNIGQINNRQDENWVIRRINRNQKLESMGVAPI